MAKSKELSSPFATGGGGAYFEVQDMQDEIKARIFSVIQKYLKNPPVIIWGSGATVPFGLPTMDDLNCALRGKISGFNVDNNNLENELEKDKYKEQMSEIRQIIWETVNTADTAVHCKLAKEEAGDFDCIKKMLEKFLLTHPKIINIITTNYDRVLEHVMGFHGIPFTDGFGCHEFNAFDETLFREKNIVNLVKVHGSLRWFQTKSDIRYLVSNYENTNPTIISPGGNKYEEVFTIPYRNLIQKSDVLIKKASSFLVVGFGFNDKHLTPNIIKKVEEGTPLVLLAKTITDGCRKALQDAQQYVLLCESTIENYTSISIKENKDNADDEKSIDGNYWQLGKFMGVL